jgi:hypothetical protein
MENQKPLRIPHNEIYNDLQEKYLETRDKRLLEKMYGIAGEVSRNYLNKYCKKKGIRLNSIDDMAHDAALFVIEQYLRKPWFKVRKLSAYIYFGVMKVLYKDRKREMNEVSYEAMPGERR